MKFATKKSVIALVIAIGLIGFAWYSSQQPTDQRIDPEILSIETVSVSEFATTLASQPDRRIIDVRTTEEFADGHISGAQNIDFYAEDFLNQFEQFAPDEPLAIYCRSGNRSSQALRQLRQAGFTDIVELEGGIVAWEQNYPLCTNQTC